MEMWWTKSLVSRGWVIRVDFGGVCVWRLMACGWWIVAVQKRLVDFHLRRIVVGPNYTGRFVVQWYMGGKESLLVICW